MAQSRDEPDANSQNETNTPTIKPDLDGIRGNDTLQIVRHEEPQPSHPSRSQPVRFPDYADFMREYIAQEFGSNEGVKKLPRELHGRSDQVAVLDLRFKTRTKAQEPTEIDLEGQSNEKRKDTLKMTLKDIDSTLQNPQTQESPPSESEQTLSRPPTSVNAKIDAASVADSTGGPRSSESKSNKRPTLSEVRNELTPRRGCNENFFPSCSESFISDWRVWSYLTEDFVRLILNECEPGSSTGEREDTADLAKTICGMPSSKTATDFISFRKVFAILILMKMHNQIREFIIAGIHDNILPLKYEGSHKDPTALLVPGDKARNPCFKDWDTADIQDFLKWQMQFCAPFFKQGERPYHYIFPNKIALPFLSLPDSQPGRDEGGYGMVTKVELPLRHGDLRTYHRGGERVFAIKKLLYPNRQEFLKEADNLGRFYNHSNQHLAILSATFEVGEEASPMFYFIFPRADSNLRVFWETHNDVDRIAKFSRWMARQFAGLASALQAVHHIDPTQLDSYEDSRSRGIHGDIKPENILFFGDLEGCADNVGTLQLADFGLTRYHHSNSVSQAGFRAGLGAYDPPERHISWKSGQALDVWALGCLFVEFGIWLIFGVDGLGKFKDSRKSEDLWDENFQPITFFEMSRDYGCCDDSKVEIRIGEGVVTWITEVHHHKTCTAFIHDIFEFIVEKMFVLDPTNKHIHSRMGWLRRLRDSRLYDQLITSWTKPSKGRVRIGEVIQLLAAINENDKPYFEQPATYGKKVWFPKPIYTHTTVTQAEDLANAVRIDGTSTPSQLYDAPATINVTSDNRATLLSN